SISRVVEAVAYAGDGQDKLWAFGDWFDFLAELCYIDVQAMCTCVGLGPPDLFEQHLAGQELAAMADEDFEQVVLGWCQGDISTVEQDSPLREVDGQGAGLEMGGGTSWGLGNMAQGYSYSGQHFVDAKGFGNIVICSQV